MPRSLRLVSIFEMGVGVAVIVWWAVMLAAGEVPEVMAGERAIWFHIVAEVVMAILLVIGGILIRLVRGPASTVSGVALGTLCYSCINSAGHFADRDEWAMVAMFAMLLVVTVAAGWSVVACATTTGGGRRAHPEPAGVQAVQPNSAPPADT